MNERLRAAAVLFVVSSVALLSAQDPPAPSSVEGPAVTFRAEVNYVEVDAFVTDAQGHVVANLRAEDFEVLEDGRPQKITAFSFVDIPIERAERPLFAEGPIELDVQTNEHVEGRVYLIVLDDQHIDVTRGPRVKAAARRFIEQNFGTNDLAAIVYTSGRVEASQEFTNNTRLLLNAIDKFAGRKPPSVTVERLSMLDTDESGRLVPSPDTYAAERPFRARAVMTSIRKLADFMAGVRGRRKAMILISEGVDYDIFAATGPEGANASALLQDSHDAIAAATRGNVSIYAIDPRGLFAGGEELIGISTTLNDQGIGLESLNSEQRRSQDSLRMLAANTGGFAALNRNDLNTAFDRIVSENSSYYLLGYYPANERRAGRFRTLEVRVTRPGLQVRARNGYFEARGRAPAAPAATGKDLSPAIAEALESPLPVAGVPMKVFAAAFKGTPPNAAVVLAIELDASRFDFVEKGGTFTERLEVTYAAYDANGKLFPGDRHTVTLTMKPDTYQRVRSNGFRALSQMNLPPGRYQLRVAAGNASGRAGSVLYDLEVPDFMKTPLSMSGVAITSASAARVATIKPKDPLADYLPGPPSAAREFATGDVLALFTEFYENVRPSTDARGASSNVERRNAPPHMLEFRAELRADEGRVVREVADERSSTELKGDAGGYGFTAQIPLEGVAPGLYVIHVEGRTRARGDIPPVSRDIQIRVR